MSRDTTVLPFRQREAIDDPLSELAREGARRMLAQVLIAEADSFVAMWKDLKLPDGRDRIVRHGYGPHRAIQTGVGPVEVRQRSNGFASMVERIYTVSRRNRCNSLRLPKRINFDKARGRCARDACRVPTQNSKSQRNSRISLTFRVLK